MLTSKERVIKRTEKVEKEIKNESNKSRTKPYE